MQLFAKHLTQHFSCVVDLPELMDYMKNGNFRLQGRTVNRFFENQRYLVSLDNITGKAIHFPNLRSVLLSNSPKSIFNYRTFFKIGLIVPALPTSQGVAAWTIAAKVALKEERLLLGLPELPPLS